MTIRELARELHTSPDDIKLMLNDFSISDTEELVLPLISRIRSTHLRVTHPELARDYGNAMKMATSMALYAADLQDEINSIKGKGKGATGCITDMSEYRQKRKQKKAAASTCREQQ